MSKNEDEEDDSCYDKDTVCIRKNVLDFFGRGLKITVLLSSQGEFVILDT